MMTDWSVSGTDLEACNCDAICPCRRVGGVTGGRSTTGECIGALSWVVEHGSADGVELDGLGVIIALRYHDDEPGSPWRWALYLDDRGSAEQRAALEEIFTGRGGGSAREHFPWAWKESHLLAVKAVPIEIDHRTTRAWFRAAEEVSVRMAHPVEDQLPVTCVIPGHDRDGVEYVAESLILDSIAQQAEFRGRCGYRSTFSYTG